jgi:hypothetical protein
MWVGIFNLVLGVALIAGALGAFGARWALLGTSSWEGLAGVGAIIAVIGAFQIFKYSRR